MGGGVGVAEDDFLEGAAAALPCFFRNGKSFNIRLTIHTQMSVSNPPEGATALLLCGLALATVVGLAVGAVFPALLPGQDMSPRTDYSHWSQVVPLVDFPGAEGFVPERL